MRSRNPQNLRKHSDIQRFCRKIVCVLYISISTLLYYYRSSILSYGYQGRNDLQNRRVWLALVRLKACSSTCGLPIGLRLVTWFNQISGFLGAILCLALHILIIVFLKLSGWLLSFLLVLVTQILFTTLQKVCFCTQ